MVILHIYTEKCIILKSPCSSVDRASASGAVCVGSTPIRGAKAKYRKLKNTDTTVDDELINIFLRNQQEGLANGLQFTTY